MEANIPIINAIFAAIKPINANTIIIMASNPLDILTLHAQEISGLPRTQVFGTGTFLDTLRLRNIIAQKLTLAPQSVDACIVGEHGDLQCAAWSCATIAGVPIAQCNGIQKKDLELMAQEVKNKAYEIIACKGATYYGIATCIATMCESIIFDQKTIMPLSVYSQEYKICFSMPAVLGENGIEKIIPIPLNSDEKKQLNESAHQLHKLAK